MAQPAEICQVDNKTLERVDQNNIWAKSLQCHICHFSKLYMLWMRWQELTVTLKTTHTYKYKYIYTHIYIYIYICSHKGRYYYKKNKQITGGSTTLSTKFQGPTGKWAWRYTSTGQYGSNERDLEWIGRVVAELRRLQSFVRTNKRTNGRSKSKSKNILFIVGTL